MEAAEKRRRAASFGSVAGEYAEYRPTYPVDAVNWLAGAKPARVLELGAGTGKLTAVLCSLGHDVLATDPDPEMLAQVRRAAPQARVAIARAEDIPVSDGSVDLVVAAQAWHWFDVKRAAPEIARVLKPGGAVGLVWNVGDVRVPWVKRVFAMVDTVSDDHGDDPFGDTQELVLLEERKVKHWQTFRRDTLTGYVRSTSKAATMSEQDRQVLVEGASALYDSYGRGPDGLLMPWVAHCFRGRVTKPTTSAAQRDVSGPADDDDGLLIDFT